MKRTQLYLDEHLRGALHSRAPHEKTTVSELVRQAVRERYIGNLKTRKAAIRSFVGIRKAYGKDRDARGRDASILSKWADLSSSNALILELSDALIAATAGVNSAGLCTRNRKHYPPWHKRDATVKRN